MNVGGHEALSEYFNLGFVAVFSEPRQIGFEIFVGEKNVFAPIAALGHVMWKASKYCSW